LAPVPYFCEDAGLFVDALSGFPGVYSRYVFSTLGCDGILRLLQDVPEAQRGARFRAVVAYVDPQRNVHLVRGEARGRIERAPRGDKGFGFDPIFVPDGERRTFAQMTPAEKGGVSHRGRALDALVEHLRVANKKV
jgi:XTP/dITP diphosphohydrolase